jgi:hypothetical protein
MTLEEKLALSKEQQHKIEKGIKSITSSPSKKKPSTMVGSVEDLDSAVFGEVQKSDSGYDAKEEMKRIQERYEKGAKINVDYGNTKIPKQIIQSIIQNPLDMPSVDPKMDAFTEKLKMSLPESINRSYEIQSRLEKQDEKQTPLVTETKTSSIDYEMIKLIVENAISKKMEEIKNTLLTESQNHLNQSPSLKAMKLGEKFLFLDGDNNVFECQMKYIGKNKKKK